MLLMQRTTRLDTAFQFSEAEKKDLDGHKKEGNKNDWVDENTHDQ
jgi:hypothetical protein